MAKKKLHDLFDDIKDSLAGDLPHDCYTNRGSLLHQLMEVAAAQELQINELKASLKETIAKRDQAPPACRDGNDGRYARARAAIAKAEQAT